MSIEKTETGIVKLKKGAKFDLALLPTIQSLVSLGFSEADIGIVVGYQGKDPREWLKGLKKRNVDVKRVCEAGLAAANVALVAKAFNAACGHYYEEESTTYARADKMGKALATPIALETVTKKRYAKPDTTLLLNLLRFRFPDEFQDIKKSERKTLNVDIAGEIEGFFGNLGFVKKVDCKETSS